PYCHSTLTNMTVRKPDYSLRYYVCPQNMNNARFVCEFKGINAQELETSVLATCQDFFQNQQLYSKINHTIQQRLKRQRDVETKTALNHEQLIEKLAQGKIDAETFREQTRSLHQQSKPLSSISAYQSRNAFQNIIQQRFTLNILNSYIDVSSITKNNTLARIYFKTEPLNIVNQTTQSSIA
ncbi:MAG: recombinase family protein, partial [Staphylococcus lugdunensis]|nr:recombinase family protein [Staphylococcus lugdunensis]